jgi:hypothetical protein
VTENARERDRVGGAQAAVTATRQCIHDLRRGSDDDDEKILHCDVDHGSIAR